MANLFSPNGNRLKVTLTDQYDAGITEEIDQQIRHLPFVVGYLNFQADKLVKATGSSNFKVITQNDPKTSRPRSYVVPKNSEGITEELRKAVLLKAALGMAGK